MLDELVLVKLMVAWEVEEAARVVQQEQDLVDLVPRPILVHLTMVSLTQHSDALLQV